VKIKSSLPPLTQQPLLHIDMTPTPDMALRILRAYRQDCDCMWADNTGGEETKNPFLARMNEDNRKRARILNEAIRILETGGSK